MSTTRTTTRTTTTTTTSPASSRPRRRPSTVAAVGVAALLALATTACGSTSDATAPAGGSSSTTAAAPGSVPGTAPASGTGLKPIDQASFEQRVASTMEERRVPGAVVLLKTPQGDFVATYGTTEIGADVAPTVDTHVRIASVSKSFTAALIQLLAEEGELSLDDPVSRYVDGVPGGDDITIAQLLEMRSGLYNVTNDERVTDGIDADQGRVWTTQELRDIAFSHPTNFEPGTDFEYSNTNYLLLGLVVEAVDGKPFAASLQERIFDPLGMADSSLPSADVTTLPAPFSHGYLYGGSAEAISNNEGYTAEQQAAVAAGTLQPTDYTGVNHTFAFGAGGMVSTATDLATFFDAYVGGGLLDAEAQDVLLASFRPEQPDNPGQQYGYGLSSVRWAGNAIDYHGGETAGFNLFAGYDRANDVTLVIWTNLAVGVEDGQANANALMVEVLDEIYATSPLAGAATTTTTTEP